MSPFASHVAPASAPAGDAALPPSLLGRLPAVFWSTDPDLRITGVCGEGLAALGPAAAEAAGRAVADVFGAGAEASPAVAAHRRALAGASASFEAEWGGRVFHARVEPLTAPDGAVTGCRGLALDVTDRCRAEQAVREREERLRTLFQGLPVPTYTWRRQGDDFVLADWNAAATAMTGGRIGGFAGASARTFFDQRPDIVQDLELCFRERTPIRRDLYYRLRTTGQLKFLSVSCVFVPPDLVMVHTEDITERRRAEEENRLLHELVLSMSAAADVPEALGAAL